MANKIKLRCDHCGKIIYKFLCRINRKNYCGNGCKGNDMIGRKQNYETIEKRRKATTGKKRSIEFKETTRKRQIGIGNSCWKGGISKQKGYAKIGTEIRRYGMSKDEALKVLGNNCSVCGMTNQESLLKYHRKLAIHHKDNNGRSTQKPNNKLHNLEVVCSSCHAKIHMTKEKALAMRLKQISNC